MPNKDFYTNKCQCGQTIGKDANKCRRCAGKENSPKKTNLPSDAVIMKMLKTKSIAKVAKELDVSETTIKKIKLKYNK